MLENHIQTVSYVISSVILVLGGDTITKKLTIPFIKNFINDTTKFWSVIIGTLLFIAWCYFGAILIGKFLLNTEVINKSNVDGIAVIGFIVLAFILNEKYKMDW